MTEARHPAVKLFIDVAGDAALIPAAQSAWQRFEEAFRVPFSYEPPVFGTCADTSVSQLSECCLPDGQTARIRVTPALLDSPAVEQNLTLLHESLHLESFLGTLSEMYRSTSAYPDRFIGGVLDRIRASYPPEEWKRVSDFVGPYLAVARRLANELFEVYVEIELSQQYPQWAAARNDYFLRLRGMASVDFVSGGYVHEYARPYLVLHHQIRDDLGAYLMDHPALVAAPDQESTAGILWSLLSPRHCDYVVLHQWGKSNFEMVFKLLAEQGFRDLNSR